MAKLFIQLNRFLLNNIFLVRPDFSRIKNKLIVKYNIIK